MDKNGKEFFSRWTKEGIFEDIFKAVIKVSIDSNVKVHQHALTQIITLSKI